ncbi:SLC13 family permease [Acidobacteria bacterium AH-259-G07]|nr:SLC13 family permease [Acidobacteria bacterium AH-259-G07]
MTLEIGFLFFLLIGMVYLFLTEKLPVDLTAFLGLVILILTGYLTAEEAFTGFASSAVITMLSIFIVSGALLHTGLADLIGGRIHALVGSREVPLIVTVMLVAGVLSAFMNNIAATAVLMPAVASIARRSRLSPSRLFMPLCFGAILGGTTTSVGTPPNIIAVSMLRERGLEPFSLFDFTPLGAVLLLTGIVFMSTVGRRLLPAREIHLASTETRDLAQVYQLHEQLFSIRIPEDSRLHGLTLGETRLGTALGVQVVAILRGGRRHLAPGADSVLKSGDVLLVEGRLSDLKELFRVQGVEVQKTSAGELPRPTRGVSGIRAGLASESPLLGRSLRELHFRERFGVVVVGIQRDGEILRDQLAQEILREGDEILALGTRPQLEEIASHPDFVVREVGLSAVQQLQEYLFLIRIPEGSPLEGSTLGSSRIGELVGLTVGGIIREGETRLAVSPDEIIRLGDRLLVAGEPSRILSLLELGDVQVDSEVGEPTLESDDVGVVEAAVAPRSAVAGRTLQQLTFRERYGLQVLAIWREGSPIRTNLATLALRFGDALLLQGSRERIRQLAAEPDFVVLSHTAQAPRRINKAPFALGGLLLMIGLVVTGFQPIHVAAFSAATLVLLAGALTMEEAYRAIEWRAIFLVAAILPVGFAMERTGAALLLATTVTDLAGPLGPHVVLAALITLSSLLSQGLDGAPTVVLLTPVVIQVAEQLSLSPYPIMMGVSLAASAAFMTPFSHKANLLVMGAGGYRAVDYLRVGTPLTVILLILLAILVPLFFPL